MPLKRRLLGTGRVRQTPAYWLEFDGANDYISLPTGEGDEPTTAIFVEAWILHVVDDLDKTIIQRGGATYDGYSLSVRMRSSSDSMYFRFYLSGPASGNLYKTINLVSQVSAYPIHLAAGWSAATQTIYYFIQGVLVATAASDDTPISYANEGWEIGRLNASLWPLSHKVSQIRVSNVLRHTSTFTPAAILPYDGDTVYLGRATAGSGITLADEAHGHDGTFKGVGEPAWNSLADCATLHHGAELWAAVLDILPGVSDVNIYAHRTDADNYEVYWKIHDTGPYWAKKVLRREGAGLGMGRGAWTGIPDPANDSPSTWTTDPSTVHQLTSSAADQYALQIDAGNGSFWGGQGHGNETVSVAEAWEIDGESWTPGNGDWGNGEVITYAVTTEIDDPVGSAVVAEVAQVITWDRSTQYVEYRLVVTWKADLELLSGYLCMQTLDTTNLSKVTMKLAGTDYDLVGVDGTAGEERSITIAAWDATKEQVCTIHVTDYNGLLRMAQGTRAFVNQNNNKLYLSLSGGLCKSGESVSVTAQWAYLDSCGNHILKTT